MKISVDNNDFIGIINNFNLLPYLWFATPSSQGTKSRKSVRTSFIVYPKTTAFGSRFAVGVQMHAMVFGVDDFFA